MCNSICVHAFDEAKIINMICNVREKFTHVSSRRAMKASICFIWAKEDNPRSKQLALRGLDLTQAISQAEWLVVDGDSLVGTISRVPERDEVDPMVNEQLVVELYSR